MRNFPVLYFFLYSLPFCAQTLTVHYKTDIVDKKDAYGITGFTDNKLVLDSHKSLYYTSSRDTIYEDPEFGTITQKTISEDKNPYYKDLVKNESYSTTFFDDYILKDVGYAPNWILSNGSKKILNYNCQEAEASYRGRNYKAYFTTEIPYANGPDRFDGLPGLIVEVLSDDGCIKIRAVSIEKSNEKIANPYIGRKMMSWSDFKINYKRYFNNMINYKPDEGYQMIVPNRGIHYYVD